MRAIPTEPCLGLVHAFEKGPDGSFAATAYQDSGGVWTIGWGHALSGPTEETWDQAKADAQALADIAAAAAGVDAALGPVPQLTPGQFAACIDFAFNEGVSRFANSTFCSYIRTGNMALAPNELKRWVYGKVNGVERELPGLVKRRAAELAVWRT